MSTILNGKYSQFTADMKSLIEKASFMHLNIFTSQAGTTNADSDSGVPVKSMLITTTSYTYPHTDTVSGNAITGSFTITFSDGATITIPDSNTGYWYSFDEITPVSINALV